MLFVCRKLMFESQALIKLDPLMRKLFNVDYKKKLQRQKFKKTLNVS